LRNLSFKNDRTVLQDFGNVLAVTGIPIGRLSGAWARAIGLALQQRWREQAAHAQYGRAGDEHRTTVKFDPFTRRELLELFKPQPSAGDVLADNNPSRAIEYWEDAIAELIKRNIVGHYGGYGVALRDWKRDRPRKGWDAPLARRGARHSTCPGRNRGARDHRRGRRARTEAAAAGRPRKAPKTL
jgi:hypothetical protein